jgi:PAS domain S-box-containing protein
MIRVMAARICLWLSTAMRDTALRGSSERAKDGRPGRRLEAGGGTVDPGIDRFYRSLAREAPDAIVYVDSSGKIAFWNKGAERIFGFSEAEAMGQTLDIIIPQNLRKRHWDGFAETVRTGRTRYGSGDILAVPALRKDGRRISVEFTILPFLDKAGRVLGMAATLRDVTKRFEETKALREQLAARRQAAG